MTERPENGAQVDPARVLQIVEAVLDLPSEVAAARIDQLCAGKPELAAQARALLIEPPEGFMRPRTPAPVTQEPPQPEGPEEPGDPIGRVLGGKYRLEQRIGAGAMGVVYRGVNVDTRGTVAIKLLHDTGISSEQEVERMVNEARAAAAVRHDNVIRVLDVDVYDGAPALVLEWVDGVDLASWTKHAREAGLFDGSPRTQDLREFVERRLGAPCTGELWALPYPKAVARLVADTARGLQAAHEGNVVHRDVAPKNILVGGAGRPLLVDFGVALLYDDASRSQRAGLAGTLPYMAPEQFQLGPSANRPAVDIYALGATLYELLTGEPPFTGSEGELIEKIRNAPTPDLRSARPQLSRDLAATTYGAMEKRPTHRYATAGELADDLEAFLEGRPTIRRPVGWPGRLVRWTQRHPARATTALALLLLLVVGGTAATQFSKSRAQSREETRRASYVDGFARLPALVTLEANPLNPGPPRPSPSDAAAGALFDELLALEPGEPMLHWYRANWRSQHGDPAGAAADLDALRAQGHGGGLLEPLAGALASEAADVRNALVEPTLLAPPETPFEYALLGYVHLRFRDLEGAHDALTLAIEKAPEHWMYTDLRSIAFLDGEALQSSLEDAHEVEKQLGRPTARSCGARAFVALNSEVPNPELALRLYEQAVELGGDYFHANNNCAVIWSEKATSAFASGEAGAVEMVANAERHVRASEALRPGLWRSELLMARCQLLRGDFDAAVQRLEAGIARFGNSPSWEAWEAMVALQQELALARACEADRLRESGDQQGARRLLIAARLGTQRLATTVGDSDPPLLAELAGMGVLLDWMLGDLSPEEADRKLTLAQADYLSAGADQNSGIIAAMRGLVYAKRGPEFRAAARVHLTDGLKEPIAKIACRHALRELEDH